MFEIQDGVDKWRIRSEWTLFINGCQFKILLYAFKLALLTSFQSNYQLQNEARKVNLTTCKGIDNWPPFIKVVYVPCQVELLSTS